MAREATQKKPHSQEGELRGKGFYGFLGGRRWRSIFCWLISYLFGQVCQEGKWNIYSFLFSSTESVLGRTLCPCSKKQRLYKDTLSLYFNDCGCLLLFLLKLMYWGHIYSAPVPKSFLAKRKLRRSFQYPGQVICWMDLGPDQYGNKWSGEVCE